MAFRDEALAEGEETGRSVDDVISAETELSSFHAADTRYGLTQIIVIRC